MTRERDPAERYRRIVAIRKSLTKASITINRPS